MTGAKKRRRTAMAAVAAAVLAAVGLGIAALTHSSSPASTAAPAATSSSDPTPNPWTLAPATPSTPTSDVAPSSSSDPSRTQGTAIAASRSPYPYSLPQAPALGQAPPPHQPAPILVTGPTYTPAPEPTCPPDKGVVFSVVGVKNLGPSGGNQVVATVAIDNHLDVPLEILTPSPLIVDTIHAGGYEAKIGETVIAGDYVPGRTTSTATLETFRGLGTSFVIPDQPISVRSIPGLGSSQLYCTYTAVMGAPYTGGIG